MKQNTSSNYSAHIQAAAQCCQISRFRDFLTIFQTSSRTTLIVSRKIVNYDFLAIFKSKNVNGARKIAGPRLRAKV